jgi:type III secretion system chaperone SycN
MSYVPSWLAEVVRTFAKGFGLENFALNEDGAAALRFEDGAVFRLEYAVDFLTLTMSAEPPPSDDAVKALLACADPLRRGAFALRVGVLERPSRAVFAIRLPSAEVTLGNLEGALAELWRATENYRRRLGA